MTELQKERGLGTLALMQIAAGGSAGITGFCLLYVIKKRINTHYILNDIMIADRIAFLF